MRRLFCCPIKEGLNLLQADEAHHGLRVLRLQQGDQVEMFDGLGHIGHGQVNEAGKRELTISVQTIDFIGPKKPTITIAASVAKSDRFDWLIGKCTELDADRICPLLFYRTVKLAKGSNIIDRYEKLALSAAKQCRRAWLPRIDGPCSLEQFLGKIEREFTDAKLIYGTPDQNGQSLLEFGKIGTDIIAVIGPEGGFTPDELQMLTEKGAIGLRLTDTVLRVETAAVAFAAALAMMRSQL